MRKFESTLLDVRVEVVTATFVASGIPEGVHDLGRFLETLNNDAMSRHLELASPAVRPLYRASDQLHLDAPLLVRRDEIIFATFEGPAFVRGNEQPTRIDAPILLLAPPFQIQGIVALAPGAIPTQALRPTMQGFFGVRSARVFDADGAALGEGEQIIVNGAAVQMASSTEQHIAAATNAPAARTLSIIEPQTADDAQAETRAA
jgi:hypothetical protein